MATILLATDGSIHSRQAAERAIELAEEQDTDLHVVCVVDERRFSNPALSTTELLTIFAMDQAHLCVTDVEAKAADRDVEVMGDIRYGRPETVILEYAEAIDAEIIVIGEHGDHEFHHSGVGRSLSDSAPARVQTIKAEPA